MKILKNTFIIIFATFSILAGIAVLVIVMFMIFLFTTTSHTDEQVNAVENYHLISDGEYEPSIESIIANFALNDSQELPMFPEFDSVEYQQYQLEKREWLETNGREFTGILKRLLSEIDSSFSDVNFSTLVDDNRDGISIIYADVKNSQITDKDIIYLIHSVITLGHSRHGITTPFRIELNLDNGNQLFIEPRDSIAYTIAYREQENLTANQNALDWWSIAGGVINIQENTISWQGFVEDEDGKFNIERLPVSPFE